MNRARTGVEGFAFSAEQVCDLTGLSKRQLFYWDKTEFFSPEFRGAPRRVYSFRDLVGLRTLAELRGRVPLQELRKVGAWLAERYATPWASLRFFLLGKKVVFREPETHLEREPGSGQRVMKVELEEVANRTKQEIDRRRSRAKGQIGQVEKRSGVARSRPVIAGTRIPVSAVWNLHRAGYSIERIIEEYPSLHRQDVEAAIRYVRAA